MHDESIAGIREGLADIREMVAHLEDLVHTLIAKVAVEELIRSVEA